MALSTVAALQARATESTTEHYVKMIQQGLSARRGPETGGGGGVLQVGRELVLLDFLKSPAIYSKFLKSISHQNVSRVSEASLSPFSWTVERPVNDLAFQEAARIFSAWEKIPFDTIGFRVQNALALPLTWVFSDDPLPLLAAGITAAYYQKSAAQESLVKINRPVWNQLKSPTQVGVIVHETLRQVQIGQQRFFDDEVLQRATVLMVLCRPSVRLNQYILFLLLNQRDVAEQRFGDFDTVLDSCEVRE